MKVLVVDDDDLLRRLLVTHLTRFGYEVVDMVDGEAAWEFMQQENIRLVVTDWMMPQMDGPELIHRIRAANFKSYTYIIILTARNTKDDVVTGLEAGADDYLVKPFNPNELRARVKIGERILNLEARLEELAIRDGLTGVFNRRKFDERLFDELHRANRYQRPISLIMIDIDHFKHYNDMHGHPQGDQLLREMAQVLTTSVRSTDLVARYGGEEFVVILPETDKAQAQAVAEKLCTTVAAHHFPFGETQPLGATTVSVGVASYIGVPEAEPPLLDLADQALYRAKREGRNRVITA